MPPRLAVVVPALDEAPRIERVVRTLPADVAHIVVVDDGSRDGTSDVVRSVAQSNPDGRVEVVRHATRRGVGAAIATGVVRARELDADIVAVLAGDGQMDPNDLPAVVAPIVEGRADYVKGNRLAWPSGWRAFPTDRLLGGLFFATATRIATGLPIHDSQCGYTAIARRALDAIDWSTMWPSYGYPNALLIELARKRLRVVEVPVRPVYEGAPSHLALRHLAPIATMLARATVGRFAIEAAQWLDHPRDRR